MTRGLLPYLLESIHKICLLSTQHLIVRGFKKQQRRRWDYSNFTKGEFFFVSWKLRDIWGNLTLYHPFLPLSKETFLFSLFWPSRKYIWHLFEKKLWFVLVPYPHRQSRKRMMNTFRYVRPKYLYNAQNTQCAQNSICPNGKHIFPNSLIHF